MKWLSTIGLAIVVITISVLTGVPATLTAEQRTSTTPLSPEEPPSDAEISIDPWGKITLRSVRVIHFIGPTIIGETRWRSAILKWIIKTNRGTSILRKFGETTALSELGIEDKLNVEGMIEGGSAGPISLIAHNIRDISIEKETRRFHGTVTALQFASSSLNLVTPLNQTITISIGTTTLIRKGSRDIPLTELTAGDRVLTASGTFDHAKKTLFADTIVVYIDMNLFKPRNFQGTLKDITDRALPTTLVISIGGKNYEVKLSNNTVILARLRTPTLLARFVVGDTIRLYGALQEATPTVIDGVEIVRNMNL